MSGNQAPAEYFLYSRAPGSTRILPSKSPEAKSVMIVQPGYINSGAVGGGRSIGAQSMYLIPEEPPPYNNLQPQPYNQAYITDIDAREEPRVPQPADLEPSPQIEVKEDKGSDMEVHQEAKPEPKEKEGSDEKKSDGDTSDDRRELMVEIEAKEAGLEPPKRPRADVKTAKEKRAPAKEKRGWFDMITGRQKRKPRDQIVEKTQADKSTDYFTKRPEPEKRATFGSMFRWPSASPSPSTDGPEDVRFKAMITDEDGLNPKAMHMSRVRGGGYRPLNKETYFHGLLPRDDIEKMLRKNGDFLCRETQIQKCKVETISVRWGDKVQHFILVKTRKGRYHIGLHTFDCPADLIDWYMNSGQPLSAVTGAVLKHKVHRRSWQLDPDQIRLHEKLGEGAFGEVFKGILVEGVQTTQVAVKRQSHTTSEDVRQQTREFLSEFKTMREFKHPNVVRVYGVAAQVDPILIVMEYLSGGSLQKYLRTQGIHIRLPNRIQFCTEAAAGMRYLERKKVLHRDIATRNCLMGPKREIKISDFGLSLFDAKEFKAEKGQKVPIRWLAPETLRTGVYTPATDVWSFGVLMWEIFADGAEPYPHLSNTQVRQKVTSSCYRMKPTLGTPTEVAQLMEQKCWCETPNKRPSFAHIHKFFTSLAKYYGLS